MLIDTDMLRRALRETTDRLAEAAAQTSDVERAEFAVEQVEDLAQKHERLIADIEHLATIHCTEVSHAVSQTERARQSADTR